MFIEALMVDVYSQLNNHFIEMDRDNSDFVYSQFPGGLLEGKYCPLFYYYYCYKKSYKQKIIIKIIIHFQH